MPDQYLLIIERKQEFHIRVTAASLNEAIEKAYNEFSHTNPEPDPDSSSESIIYGETNGEMIDPDLIEETEQKINE